MKKIKIFFVTVICAISLCLAFAGCAGSGNYVKNTLSYSYESKTSYSYSIDCTFEIFVNRNGNYNVDYALTVYDNEGHETYVYSNTETLTDCKTDRFSTVSKTFNLYNFNEDYSIILTHVNVYEANYYGDDAVDYAIGFGIAGGLILCGVVALFIVLKVKDKKN